MKINIAAALGIILSLCGCATQHLSVTSMAYSPETMDLIGPVEGEVTRSMFLCFPPFSTEENLINAITKALTRPDRMADAILNPAVETTRSWWLVYCEERVRVYGSAVRFKRPPLPTTVK